MRASVFAELSQPADIATGYGPTSPVSQAGAEGVIPEVRRQPEGADLKEKRLRASQEKRWSPQSYQVKLRLGESSMGKLQGLEV